MKHSVKVLPIVLALMLLFAQPAFAAEMQQTNMIQTSATSTIKVDPDLVQLDLTIRTEENSAALAQENNAAAVDKAMNLLLSEGLSKDEIKTTSYSTYSYTNTDNDNEITVYATNSSLEATFKQLNLVGEILNKLAAINEVNVSSVNYSIQNPSQYKEETIASAIAAAKQNITYSAEALSVKLDKLVNLNIDFSSNSDNQPFSKNSAAISGSAATPQLQNPDKITLSATANMSYSIQQ